MKKLILVVCLVFSFVALVFSGGLFWEYSGKRNPTNVDVIKAEVNTAIAIQKIAEEGITVRVIIEDNTN